MQCYDLMTLTSLWNFTSSATSINALTIYIYCENCPALVTFGSFPGVTSFVVSSFTLICSDCPSLVTFGSFPNVASMSGGAVQGTERFYMSCGVCGSLVTMGAFPSLVSIAAAVAADTAQLDMNFLCTDCNSLLSFGSLSHLASITSLVGSGQTTQLGIIYDCVNCTSLVTLGNFPALTTLSGDTTIVIPFISCTSCPALTSMGHLSALKSLAINTTSSAMLRFLPTIGCSDCTSLTSLGSMPLANLTCFSPAGCYIYFDPIYSCSGCPALTSLADFGSLTSQAVTSVSNSSYIFSPYAWCEDCGALTVLGNFSQAPFALYPGVMTIQPTFSCTTCPLLVHIGSLANFVAIPTLPTMEIFVSVDITVTCLTCPRLLTASPLSGFVSPVIPDSPPVASAAMTLTALCSDCPLVTSFADFPSMVAFANGVPSLPSTFVVNATCLSCGALSNFGDFSAFTEVGLNATVSLTYTCVSCPSLTSMGSFSQLQVSSNIVADSYLLFSYTCTDCDSLTVLADFSASTIYVVGEDSFYTYFFPVVSCTNCAALRSLALFPFFSIGIELPHLYPLNLSYSCVNCSSLQSLGVFPSMGDMEANALFFGPTFACADCPSLTQLASFPVLGQMAGIEDLTFAPALSCTNCPTITSLGVFQTFNLLFQADALFTFAPLVTCTNCSSLQVLGEYFFSSLGVSQLDFSPQFSCTSCPNLTTMGAFPSLTSLSVVRVALSPFSGVNTFAPSFTCTSCPSLTSLGNFSSLTSLQAGCPGCPNPTDLGELQFSPIFTCIGCSLAAFVTFPALSVLYSLGPTAILLFGGQFTCQQCSQLTTFAGFPLLTNVSAASPDSLGQYHSATATFSATFTCLDCSALLVLLDLPALPQVVAESSFSGASYSAFSPTTVCETCNALQISANLSSLLEVPSTSQASFSCVDCPSLTSFVPFLDPLDIDPNLLSYTFSYTCEGCPELTLSTAGLYTFVSSVPSSLLPGFGIVVGLKFQNLTGVTTLPTFGTGLSRVTSLQFDSNPDLVNVDALWRVTTIDSQLSVISCPSLVNIEGLRVGLKKVGSVYVANNAQLCPSRLSWLVDVSTSIPISGSNGYLAVACGAFVPIACVNVSATAQSTGAVLLTWVIPPQPSANVLFQVLMNNALITSFYAASPISSFLVSQTVPGSTYAFSLSSSIDGAVVYSPTVSASIPSVLTGCDAGFAIETSMGNCTACAPGTFQLAFSCVPCQVGTHSTTSASFSIYDCAPCPAGTYTSLTGQSTCSPCEGACLVVGSMVPSPAPIPARSFELITFDPSGSTLLDAVASISGWYYLVAFAAGVLLSVLLFTLLRRYTGHIVSKVAIILRTPFTRLFVTNQQTLAETPSFVRGLVGICVILGLLVVTAYQIQVFAVDGRIQLTAVQPGTTFDNGNATSTTATTFSVTFVLFQSAASCDPSLFTFNVEKTDGFGPTETATVDCSFEASTSTLTLAATFSRPSPLMSFTSSSVVTLNVTSEMGNAVFAHGLNYSIRADTYQGMKVQMTEVLSAAPGLMSGAEIVISTIPTEYLIDGNLESVGYTYTYQSSTLVTPAIPFSPTLTVDIFLPASDYFFQVRSVQNVSGLQFVAGLVALASGVLTGGSVLANTTSYGLGNFWARRRKMTSSTATSIALVEPGPGGSRS